METTPIIKLPISVDRLHKDLRIRLEGKLGRVLLPELEDHKVDGVVAVDIKDSVEIPVDLVLQPGTFGQFLRVRSICTSKETINERR
jgi:hypothetical protein